MLLMTTEEYMEYLAAQGTVYVPGDYEVDIQFVPTGEVRTTKHSGGFSEFIWSDGNDACDCNRSAYFRRAGGEPDDLNPTCAGERYRVVAVRMATGEPIPYTEADADA